MVILIMKLSRLFLPVSLAFALLFAQQVGAEHSLSHALEELSQKDKQAPHSRACDKCDAYAQLGSALTVGAYVLPLPPALVEEVRHFADSIHYFHILAAAARGPPSLHQYFV
jgi:uncharacterized membrane protein